MTKQAKVLTGKVVSDKMDKSIVVMVEFNKIDTRFKKTVRRSKKVMAHDEENKARVGDKVKVQESRPLSRNKRYELVEVVAKAQGSV